MLAERPHDPPHAAAAAEPAAIESRAAVEIESVRLLQGRREICIRHGDECYRLRHTRNDKLILTK